MLLSGLIKAATQTLHLIISSHEGAIQFYITFGLHFPVVLGLTWLWMHDLQIYRSQNFITFPSLQCGDHTRQVCASQLLSPTGMPLPSDLADFVDVFNEQETDQLPPYRPYDCPIHLLPDMLLPLGHLYSMLDPELAPLWDFLDKNLPLVLYDPHHCHCPPRSCL